MPEEINEMERQKRLDELNAKVTETCRSEKDLAALMNGGEPVDENGELSAEALDLVVGGMTKTKAIAIVSKAYWDLCICHKKKTSYSNKQISEALDICDRMNAKLYNLSIKALGWGLGKLIGL